MAFPELFSLLQLLLLCFAQLTNSSLELKILSVVNKCPRSIYSSGSKTSSNQSPFCESSGLQLINKMLQGPDSSEFLDSLGPNVREASLKKNDDRVVASKSLRAYIAGIIADFLILLVPWSLFLTVLSEWISLSLALVILSLLISLAELALSTSEFKKKRFGSFHQENGVISLRKNVSSYMVSLMLLTCMCILAVDFKIYPRRHAKAETYGVGLNLDTNYFMLYDVVVIGGFYTSFGTVSRRCYSAAVAVAVLAHCRDSFPYFSSFHFNFDLLINSEAPLAASNLLIIMLYELIFI
ncbi:hypothetical protein M9H77_16498 [Catharanthus roseus]|uniref:Uncharacterized protein n=1 Tax=Catharanthus roseus TaxID=4058 RepID=A0ACC0B1Y2_CATRO|nr:hypothetical protein M9H77_16498 [Catharanthus roseus]